MKPTRPTKETSKFLKEIGLDEKFWNEWTASPACFFSSKELTIINGFILTGSHHHASTILSISASRARSSFKRCKWLIKWAYPKFQKWITENLLEEYGVIRYESDTEKFLHSPIEHLPIDLPLKRKVVLLLSGTMHELLLEYSERDIKRVKGWGNKTFKEFKLLLEENNCLDLLKK